METLLAEFLTREMHFDFDNVNYPMAPVYGTYISHVIRYSQACHNYDNFPSRHSMLAERLFSQGFSARKTDENILQICG